jgi:cytochrome c-type biogenesis protein CcmH/NrfG
VYILQLWEGQVRARDAMATAEFEFRRAHSLQPSDPRPLVNLAEFVTVGSSPSNFTKAQLVLEEALRCAPQSASALGAYGLLLWMRGGDTGASAEQILERAVELEPRNVKTLCGYARVLKGSGRRREALKTLQVARDLALGGPLELFVAHEAEGF